MEKWKKLDVIGPEAEVSSLGRIRRRASYKGVELKDKVQIVFSKDSAGYPIATFRDGRKQQNRYVHRLVAQAFIPNPNKYRFIAHKDGNLENTAADNLAWVRHPREYSNAGEGRVLSEADVAQIKKQLLAGRKQAAIAADFKVHPSLISHIKAGRKWK